MTQRIPMPNPKGNPSSLPEPISKWNHSPTRTVRVPTAFTDKVIEYARKLDKDEPGLVRKDNSHILDKTIASGFYRGQKVSDMLTDVISVLEAVSERKIRSYSSRDRQKIQELVAALYTVCQANQK